MLFQTLGVVENMEKNGIKQEHNKKQNVFNDFIAAAEFLIKNKFTNPEFLAIRGGLKWWLTSWSHNDSKA